MSDAGGGLIDACQLYSSYRFYGKTIDRADRFNFRQSVAGSAPRQKSAASALIASSGGVHRRGKIAPRSASPY